MIIRSWLPSYARCLGCYANPHLCSVDADFVVHQASTIVGSSLITLQVHAGYGRHVYYLSKIQLVETAKWTVSTQIPVVIGICFLKISVCFFVLRMISDTIEAIRRVIVGFMTILSVLTVVNMLLLCLQCMPIQGFWDPRIKAHCMKPSDVEKISKAFSGKLHWVQGTSDDSGSGSFRCGYRFSLRIAATNHCPGGTNESKN